MGIGYLVDDLEKVYGRRLWHAFADLERVLHIHIHLENNVLHMRVRSGE